MHLFCLHTVRNHVLYIFNVLFALSKNTQLGCFYEFDCNIVLSMYVVNLTLYVKGSTGCCVKGHYILYCFYFSNSNLV